MFGYSGCGDGWVSIRSGKPNGRSTFDVLEKGTVRIKGINSKNIPVERITQFREGQIYSNILKENGKIIHHVRYGQFERTITKQGTEIIRFRGEGRGKHGKALRHEELFGHKGTCHSWYKYGRLVRQKFIYDNRKTAYNYTFSQTCKVKDYEGNILFETTGYLDGNHNAYEGGHTVLDRPMSMWFSHRSPFSVKSKGKIVYKGQYQNNQKVGEWIEDGKSYFYQNGLAIPKELYETPGDQLDPKEILKISNAQLRMAMCAKIGNERLASIGKIVHKDGDMKLLKIKGTETNILVVKCPSTKAFYYLNVPKDTTECEQARQWTFGVGDSFRQPIRFCKET